MAKAGIHHLHHLPDHVEKVVQNQQFLATRNFFQDLHHQSQNLGSLLLAAQAQVHLTHALCLSLAAPRVQGTALQVLEDV